ncbi:MAG: NACHT domain-containing protein [Salinispira sp.]
MDKKKFIEIVTVFADNSYVIADNRGVSFDIDGANICVELKKTNEGLRCVENGYDMPVRKWISKRLGRLDTLATAILEKTPNDLHIIPVPAKENDKQKSNGDAVCFLQEKIEQVSENFSTNVIYLTSEGGEGKTSVMNALARTQASLFKADKSDWLFVPIALSGRPFLRLDEIIIGTLANLYRFRSYYIESFLELVKQGLIVLGLDGFEEMTIEGMEGDVVSSLGNLLDSLDSNGTMVFAARKAYYFYANLKLRAKFLDSFSRTKDVDFSEIFLSKWTKAQLVFLLEKFGFNTKEANDYYKDISDFLSPNHPVLTRAVLARKLVEEISEDSGSNIQSVVDRFKNKREVFLEFVTMILQRETQKWVPKENISESLLTFEQHQGLLTSLAEELWIINSTNIKQDILIALTKLYCESLKFSPTIITQCVNLIGSHVLITLGADGRYGFCHDEFYFHFLGRFIAKTIATGSELNIRKILNRKVLPLFTIDECCHVINVEYEPQKVDAIAALQRLSESVETHSCISQNICSILIRLLHNNNSKFTIDGLYCSGETLSHVPISNIEFKNCFIERVEFNKYLKNVSFSLSELCEAVISPQEGSNLKLTINDDFSIPQKLIIGNDQEEVMYDRSSIISILIDHGVTTGFPMNEKTGNVPTKEKPTEDPKIAQLFKIIRAFQRSTGLNEYILKTKLGNEWPNFEKDVLEPILLKQKIFEKPKYRGHGNQRRFKLGVSFGELENAREKCRGNFETLIEILALPGNDR